MNTNDWSRIINGICLIAMSLLAASCYRSPQEGYIEATKKSANADSIRDSVLPLLSKYHYDSDPSHVVNAVPPEAIPQAVKSLPLFNFLPPELRQEPGQPALDTTWVDTNTDILLFSMGSGFGHWGIAVCKDGHEHDLDNVRYYTYWTNGIYFYNGQ